MTIYTQPARKEVLANHRARTAAVVEAIVVAPDGDVQITKVTRPQGLPRQKPASSRSQWSRVAKRRIAKIFGTIETEKQQRQAAHITAIIPAHNEQHSIANTLASLLCQTRPIDRVVVVVNGSTDKTADIVRLFCEQFPGVVSCVENPVEQGRSGRPIEIKSKVAALNYAWRHYVAHRPARTHRDEYVMGLDADVILEHDVVERLEATLDDDADRQKIGGVRPVYGFAASEATSWRTRSLVAAQQIDFAGTELKDQLRRDHRVTILGGQATLFRRTALEKVSAENKNKGPWNDESLVEDAYLTRKFEAHGYVGVVNAGAYAAVGAMQTTHAWWNQRRKWQNGHLIDVASEKHFTLDRARWAQQIAMAFNWVLRVLFASLLIVSVAAGSFVFNVLWLIPIALASLQGTLIALRMKKRSNWLIIRSATYVLPELYTWKTLAVWSVSLKKGFLALVNSGRIDQSDWIRQARAESSQKVGSWPLWIAIGMSVAVPIAGICVVGFFVPGSIDSVLHYGWRVLAVMSIIASLFMLLKIARILKNYHKLSL